MNDAVKTKVDELRDALSRRKTHEHAADPTPSHETAPDEVANGGAARHADPAATVSDDPDATRTTALEEQLTTALTTSQEWQDRYLRTVAEMENLRKRAERERTDAVTFANERLVKELMPVLDHLDAALANIPDAARSDDPADAAVRAFAEGVELTRRQFLSILERAGCSVIGAATGTPFDPACHEAISHVDAEEVASGQIVTCHRAGYRLHTRVIRAALVTVAR